MKKKLADFVFLILLITIPSFGVAQCKPFIKKVCLPKLAPFTSDGQLNNTTLRAGETAELQMTFYSGQNYRIMVCSQDLLGDVQFTLMDGSRNVVYNSKNRKKEDQNYWDFNVESTQQLIVEVTTPPSSSGNDLTQSGCVSVLVGFKDAKK